MITDVRGTAFFQIATFPDVLQTKRHPNRPASGTVRQGMSYNACMASTFFPVISARISRIRACRGRM